LRSFYPPHRASHVIHKIVSLWKTVAETGMKHGVTLVRVERIQHAAGWSDLARFGHLRSQVQTGLGHCAEVWPGHRVLLMVGGVSLGPSLRSAWSRPQENARRRIRRRVPPSLFGRWRRDDSRPPPAAMSKRATGRS
jgi:hypothetical protein